MAPIKLASDGRGYTYLAIEGLLSEGWKIKQIPERGHLRLNRQRVQLLHSGHQEILRLMIYKVGGSGRGRPGERRIEITSTYLGGLESENDTVDVLLGYDPDTDVFVGFDSRRLYHGGQTENASAFIDVEGLRLGSGSQIVVLPRISDLFGQEYHAFFRPPRLAEYIVNRSLIHAGAYFGSGPFSGTYRRRQSASSAQVDANAATGETVVLEAPTGVGRTREPSKRDLESIETGQTERFRTRKVTPEQFEALLRAKERNGALGEFIALEYERKRLARAGLDDLAIMVHWTSKENVAAGFDITSFNVDGSRRFIEVKATVGHDRWFVVTRNEWRTARVKNDQYWIYLVTEVNDDPHIVPLQNPIRLESEGMLTREADGWVVRIEAEMQ
jgi:hypothetical protein